MERRVEPDLGWRQACLSETPLQRMGGVDHVSLGVCRREEAHCTGAWVASGYCWFKEERIHPLREPRGPDSLWSTQWELYPVANYRHCKPLLCQPFPSPAFASPQPPAGAKSAAPPSQHLQAVRMA